MKGLGQHGPVTSEGASRVTSRQLVELGHGSTLGT
jgi:hypothetical protein